MPARAYVLIEATVGKTKEVAAALGGLEGIYSAEAVTGPYDIIVIVEAPDLGSIGDIVTEKVHATVGINRSVTCLSFGS